MTDNEINVKIMLEKHFIDLQEENERLRMTLRDQFAMAALTGLLADYERSGSFKEHSHDSYRMADAMMEARGESEGERSGVRDE